MRQKSPILWLIEIYFQRRRKRQKYVLHLQLSTQKLEKILVAYKILRYLSGEYIKVAFSSIEIWKI